MTPKKVELSSEILQEALLLIGQEKMNSEISRALGLSTYVLAEIRKDHGRPPSPGRWKSEYREEQRQQMIELLKEGNTVHEISRITGVKPNTLRSWRKREIEKGNNLPIFEAAPIIPPAPKYKYSDEDIIEIILLNPGYGLNRLIDVLYPKPKSKLDVRFRITELLEDYKEFFGEDLYSYLQNPDLSRMVTEKDWLQITGEKQLPKGYGRGHAKRKGNKSSSNSYVPLPPQDFNWGDIAPK